MDITPLENLGLTPTEIKVYLCLLKMGASKAGPIVKNTGLQNSVVHLTLGKLVNCGLISFSKSNQIKIYQANDPKYLLNLADERKKNLELLVPKLTQLRANFKLPEAEIYQGIVGLKNMCYKFIEDSQPGDEFLFFGFYSSNESYVKEVYEFYRSYTDLRLNRGIVLKGIANEFMREQFISNKWPHKNIKFINFPIIQNTSVFNNKVMFVPWENSQTSFLISSEGLAEYFRNYFYLIWNNN